MSSPLYCCSVLCASYWAPSARFIPPGSCALSSVFVVRLLSVLVLSSLRSSVCRPLPRRVHRRERCVYRRGRQRHGRVWLPARLLRQPLLRRRLHVRPRVCPFACLARSPRRARSCSGTAAFISAGLFNGSCAALPCGTAGNLTRVLTCLLGNGGVWLPV